MAKPKLNRPDTPLSKLLEIAAELGLSVEVVRNHDEWPLWAPEHPYRHSSCEKKSPYLYVEGAIAEAISIYRSRGEKLRVYPCPAGLHYHLTKLGSWAEQDPGPPRPKRRTHSLGKRRSK